MLTHSHLTRRLVPSSAIAVVAIALLCVATAAFGYVSHTYTNDADFDQGSLLNVNHDTPAHDQLQLNQATTPFPFVNVACSGRGTIVRIDVVTGAILGEYWTAPDNMGRNPSRTTVDKYGNVWVTNRDESGWVDNQSKGSITRVGLVIGGTRCDASGTPDVNGQYLKPPFAYNTCVDKNGDGLIKTSRGLGNILPWTNAGNADALGGVTTADDEAIMNYTRVTGSGARTVAIDRNNDVWVGGLNDLDHEKLSGLTGQPIPGTQFNQGCGGYGGLVDGNGILWSARGNGSMLRFDPATMTGFCTNAPYDGYGLGVDPATGHIWHSSLTGNRIYEFDPAGNMINTFGHGTYYAQGVAVDAAGNVWVAGSLYDNYTGHLRTDGTFIGNVYTPSGPTGVAVDAFGKVWVTGYNSSTVMRIDPNLGPIVNGVHVGEVDLTVDLGGGAWPYNYSDMTGYVAIGTTSPQGTWTTTFDGINPGTEWGTASWHSDEPLGTGVGLEVRAADDPSGLPSMPFVPVSNGLTFSGITGRYIEMRATLSRGSQVNTTPTLYDLTIEGQLPTDAQDVLPPVDPSLLSKVALRIVPNVAHTVAMVRYTLPVATTVQMRLLDASGRVVQQLVDAEVTDGSHSVRLDATRVPSGTYFLRLETPYATRIERIVIQK